MKTADKKHKGATVELPPDLRRRLKVMALENDTTIKAIVIISVEYYLNHIEKYRADQAQ